MGDQGRNVFAGHARIGAGLGDRIYQRSQRVQTVQQGIDDRRVDGQCAVPQVVQHVFHLVRQVADRQKPHRPAGAFEGVGGPEDDLQDFLRVVAALHG